MRQWIYLAVIGWGTAVLSYGGEVSLPPGAVVEFRLTGKEQFGAAYEKSALGMIIRDPKMQIFLERPKEWATGKLESKSGSKDLESARKLIRKLLAKPGALGVYPGTKVGVVWVSALGPDAPEVEKLLADAQKDVHLGVGEGTDRSLIVKDILVFASTPELMAAAKGALEKPAVSSTPAVVGTAVGWLHVDVPALRKMIHDQAKQAGKADAVLTALGVDSLRQIDGTLSFDGPALRTAMRALTAGEPTGIIKALTALPPLDDAALKMLPRDCASGAVARMNLPAVWEAVLQAIQGAAGEAEWQKFEAKRTELEAKLQFKFREDLLASLGDTVAFYSKTSISPLMPGETAFVVALKDPAKFSACVDKLVAYGNQKLAAQAGQMPMKLQVSEVEERKVYSLMGMPFLSPAWTVKGNRLIVSMNPVGLNGAIGQIENPKTSILDNEDFQRSRKALPAQAVAVSYEDTKQAVAGLYGMLALAGPMVAMQAGATLPVDLNLLPSLQSIQEKLFGTVCVVTTDAQGLTMNNYGPFGNNIGVGASSGMLLGMALPALNSARGKAQQANCGANLKQIGLACHMYADDHADKFPDKLDTLAGDYLKSKNALHCPLSPGNDDSISYGYIQGLTVKDSAKILAFDADGNHRDGRNVLYGDGHVQWMPEAQFQEAIRRQTK